MSATWQLLWDLISLIYFILAPRASAETPDGRTSGSSLNLHLREPKSETDPASKIQLWIDTNPCRLKKQRGLTPAKAQVRAYY